MNEWRDPGFNFTRMLHSGQISWPCLASVSSSVNGSGVDSISYSASFSRDFCFYAWKLLGVTALTQREVCRVGPQEGRISERSEQRWFLEIL